MEHVNFKNRTITMACNLYQPQNLQEGARRPAIVMVYPYGGAKE